MGGVVAHPLRIGSEISGGNLLQVTIATGIVDQATQRQTQQVGGLDHFCQVSSEGIGGIEPIGAIGVALKDDLNSGAVDLNIGDGAGLFGGEGAEDRSGCGGHRSVAWFALKFYRVGGDPSTTPNVGSAAGATAADLIAVCECLIIVATFRDRIPSPHCLSSSTGITSTPEELSIGH